MQPNNSSNNNTCKETRAKCVVWDGPTIDCLGIKICKGDSIDIIVYNTAKKLCEILNALKIDVIDFSCLVSSDVPGNPQNIQELLDLITRKVCNLSEKVEDIQTATTTPIVIPLPDCDTIISNCPANIKLEIQNPDGTVSTSAELVPYVEFLAATICDLLCRMSTAESNIADLRYDVDQLMLRAEGALPSVIVDECINGNSDPQAIVDPNNPAVGVIPDMASLLCDIQSALGTPSDISSIDTSCESVDVSTLAPLGYYPYAPATMADITGWVSPATTLADKIQNLFITVCDIRNFSSIVKSTCCPTLCAGVIFDMAAIPTTSGRDVVRIILNGTIFDPVLQTNRTATFDLGVGQIVQPLGPNDVPPGWLLNVPYTITITDNAFPPNTCVTSYNDLTALYNGYTGGGTGYLDIPVTFPSSSTCNLDTTTNYTVILDAIITAPDHTTCNISSTVSLPTTCQNYSVTAPTIIDYTFNGLTISFGQPGTTATLDSYIIEVLDGSGVVGTFTGTAGFTTFYIYPDITDDPSGNAALTPNAFIASNDLIEPNTTYTVRVTAVYDCGNSIPVATATGVTTFVGVTLRLNAISTSCILTSGASVSLNPDPATSISDISVNFSNQVYFNSVGNVVSVWGRPGIKFGITVVTPSIYDTPFIMPSPSVTPTNCDINPGTGCWGPPSLYQFGSAVAGTHPWSSDVLSTYTSVGCYDYVNCTILADSGLGYTGLTLVNNIDTTTGTGMPGSSSWEYVSATNAFVIPSVNTNITINTTPHLLNAPSTGGSPTNVKMTVKINDPNSWLANKQLGYLKPAGSGISTIEYNQYIKTLLTNYGGKDFNVDPYSWATGIAVGGGVVTGFASPAFVRVIVQSWNGSSYAPASTAKTYDITFDWLNLTDITGGGFTIPQNVLPAINPKDLVSIIFSSGCNNNNSGSDYDPTGLGVPPGNATDVFSTVKIIQDPYASSIIAGATNPGPFFACELLAGNDYTDATTGGSLGSSYDTTIKFVATTDFTVEWTIDDNTLTC